MYMANAAAEAEKKRKRNHERKQGLCIGTVVPVTFVFMCVSVKANPRVYFPGSEGEEEEGGGAEEEGGGEEREAGVETTTERGEGEGAQGGQGGRGKGGGTGRRYGDHWE